MRLPLLAALFCIIACTPVSAQVKVSKYPWINTWGLEYYDSNNSTLLKDAGHFDIHMGPHNAQALKDLVPGCMAIEYVLLDTQIKDGEGDEDRRRMAEWVAAHPVVDIEDMYIHYQEDVTVRGKDGVMIKIPGWDPVQTNPNATAKTRADSRVYYYEWLSYFYPLNLGNPAYRRYRAFDCARKMGERAGFDGFMADTVIPSIKKPQVTEGRELIAEYPDQVKWKADFTTTINEVRSACGPKKLIIPNTSGYHFPEAADAGGGEHEEMYVAFTNEHGPEKWDYLYKQSKKGKYSLVYPSYDSYPQESDRERMHYLAWFYIAQQPYVYLGFRGFGYTDILKWASSGYDWLPAAEFDVGVPVEDSYKIMAKGTDPAGQAYVIYTRKYSRALMVCRPKLKWSDSEYGKASGVTFNLPTYQTTTGTSNLYRVLSADGTLGPPVSAVTLRMPEGHVLIRRDDISLTKQVSSEKVQVMNVRVSAIGARTATISWTTNAMADSTVEYGKSDTYCAQIRTPELVTSHKIMLIGLEPGVTYHYRVKSVDSTEVSAVSQDSTFATAIE